MDKRARHVAQRVPAQAAFRDVMQVGEHVQPRGRANTYA